MSKKKVIEVNFEGGLFLINEVSNIQSLQSSGFGEKNGELFILNIYEVLYLYEKKKIVVICKNKKLDFNEICKVFRDKDVLLKYLVYKDLKSCGYLVKSGLKFGFEFRIYDKGIKAGEDHSLWLVKVFNENDKIKILDLVGENRVAHSTRKKMLFAIVSDEKSVTYIENSWKRM